MVLKDRQTRYFAIILLIFFILLPMTFRINELYCDQMWLSNLTHWAKTLAHCRLNISWISVDWQDTVLTDKMFLLHLHGPPRCSIQNFKQQNDTLLISTGVRCLTRSWSEPLHSSGCFVSIQPGSSTVPWDLVSRQKEFRQKLELLLVYWTPSSLCVLSLEISTMSCTSHLQGLTASAAGFDCHGFQTGHCWRSWTNKLDFT